MMDIAKQTIEKEIVKIGLTDYKWITPESDILTGEWVRFHCMFGCDNYGQSACCPPAVPPVDECVKMIMEYSDALLLHCRVPFNDYESYSVSVEGFSEKCFSAEKSAFHAGCYKAFLMKCGSCRLCEHCPAGSCREKCVNKSQTRPSIEAMGVDVFGTARKAGYSVDVVGGFHEDVDLFAILLLN